MWSWKPTLKVGSSFKWMLGKQASGIPHSTHLLELDSSTIWMIFPGRYRRGYCSGELEWDPSSRALYEGDRCTIKLSSARSGWLRASWFLPSSSVGKLSGSPPNTSYQHPRSKIWYWIQKGKNQTEVWHLQGAYSSWVLAGTALQTTTRRWKTTAAQTCVWQNLLTAPSSQQYWFHQPLTQAISNAGVCSAGWSFLAAITSGCYSAFAMSPRPATWLLILALHGSCVGTAEWALAMLRNVKFESFTLTFIQDSVVGATPYISSNILPDTNTVRALSKLFLPTEVSN